MKKCGKKHVVRNIMRAYSASKDCFCKSVVLLPSVSINNKRMFNMFS